MLCLKAQLFKEPYRFLCVFGNDQRMKRSDLYGGFLLKSFVVFYVMTEIECKPGG